MTDEDVGSIAIERRLAGSGALPLRGVAGLPLPAHVREAVAAALEVHDVTPPSRGLGSLREAIASLTGHDPETDILVTNGAMQALGVCFRALLEPGDAVIVPTPAFYFGGLIERAGGRPVYVPSGPAGGWRWDVEAIERAASGARALVLCNPCNPTGYLPDAAAIAALVDVAERHELLLVTDEAYDRYVYDGLELASVMSRTREAILIRSLGKSFALPSWRLGFLAGPAELVERCLRVFEWDCLRCPHVTQCAAAAAISGPQDWLADVPREFGRKRDLALAALRETGRLTAVQPQAGPFLFLDLHGADAEELLDLGIPVVSGRYFQAEGYARLAFGADDEALAALRERLLAWAGNPH